MSRFPKVAFMQLLAQEEYGLRCLLALARHDGTGPLTIQEIASAEGLGSDYVAKLLGALRRGGLVASTRGAAGGYRLARSPESITAWDAVQVLGGSLFPERFCECHPGRRRGCVHRDDCALRALWRRVDDAVRGVLSGISLADLRRPEGQITSWLGDAAQHEPAAPPAATPRPRRASWLS
jgi:Rrf2 family protein